MFRYSRGPIDHLVIVVEQNHNGIGKLMVPAFQIYANQCCRSPVRGVERNYRSHRNCIMANRQPNRLVPLGD